MTSETLVAIQAASTAVSALTAAGLVALTVEQSRDRRRTRDRDLAHDQLRRIVDALSAIRTTIRDGSALDVDLDVSIAQLAAALALRPVPLSACAMLARDDMPRPPYAMGDTEHWTRLEAALAEVRVYAMAVRQ